MRFFFFLLFAAAAFAQEHPEFVWQGQVDGTAVLYVHSDRVDIAVKEGAPVTQQQYRFYHPLPQTRQDARLQVREGRGYVQVIDQPRIDNQFTLGIKIEDRQPGSSPYSIAVYWDVSNRTFEHTRGEGRTDRLAWSGRVDETAIVACQRKACTTTEDRGAPVAAERVKFTKALPDHAVEVTLAQQEGRGEIRLVEQPSERNHYTARVAIRDPQSGSSDYSFTLTWNRTAVAEPLPASRGLVWAGTVAGRVRVTVRSAASFSQSLEGGRISGEKADFVEPLPARSDLMPVLKILEGPGRATILESPSEQNHYELIFEIIDPGPGANQYQIEVDW